MTLFFVVPILIALLPMAASDRRSLFWIVRVIGGLLGFLWAVPAFYWARTGYGPGFGGYFVLAVSFLAGIGCAAMAFARAAGLALQRRGWSRLKVLFCDLAGVITVIAIFVSPPIWQQKNTLRTPPEACLSRPLKVRIAGLEVTVPNRPGITVFLHGPLETGGRFLASTKHQRFICYRSSNGLTAINAAALSFGGHGWTRNSHEFCDDVPAPWNALMCRDTNPGGESPVDLVLMGPSADAGSFGYSIPTKSALESFRQRNSWKADARAVGAGGKVVRYADDYLVLTEPDGTKIVAACRVFGDRLQCRVNEQLSSVVRVGWKFDADDANVIERFVTERALIRQLLDVMQIK